jgi:hypothetical protein
MVKTSQMHLNDDESDTPMFPEHDNDFLEENIVC